MISVTNPALTTFSSGTSIFPDSSASAMLDRRCRGVSTCWLLLKRGMERESRNHYNLIVLQHNGNVCKLSFQLLLGGPEKVNHKF